MMNHAAATRSSNRSAYAITCPVVVAPANRNDGLDDFRSRRLAALVRRLAEPKWTGAMDARQP